LRELLPDIDYKSAGLTDAKIADALADKFGNSLSPERFNCMKNGMYDKWTAEENKRRSERLGKVLARGRRKITSIVRGAYLKAALGGRKIKSSTITKHKKGFLRSTTKIAAEKHPLGAPP